MWVKRVCVGVLGVLVLGLFLASILPAMIRR